MEGISCSPMCEAPDIKVSANVKTEKNSHYFSHSSKGRAVGTRRAPANHMDDETEVAKAKLRHQELMGHIKVEVDEVSGGAPSQAPHVWVRRPALLHCMCRCALAVSSPRRPVV